MNINLQALAKLGIYEDQDGEGPYFSWTGDPNVRYYYYSGNPSSRNFAYTNVWTTAIQNMSNQPRVKPPPVPRGRNGRFDTSG